MVGGAAGGLGSMMVQNAVNIGATVIGLASVSKHDVVIRNGAAAVFAYDAPGWSREVLAQTEGRGVDVFIDSQGDMGSDDAFNVLSSGGRWIIDGWMDAARAGFPSERIRDLIFKNITIRGYSVGSNEADFAVAAAELFGDVVNGTLRVELTRFALEDAEEAHRALESRATTGKVVLIP